MNTLTLNNKKQMPVLGLGTWRASKDKVGAAVKYALVDCKYDHVDCAAIYGNEKEIGKAFKEVFSTGTRKRKDIFITSKLWNTEHHPSRVEKACRQTLKDLQLEYLDLYLVHWGIAFKNGGDSEPIGKDGIVKTEAVSLQDTWRAMEKLVKKGLVKSIGVANYTAPMLNDLLSYARVKPVVNQIEIHPYNTQQEAVGYCHKKGIVVTAYSPLGSAAEDYKASLRPVNDKVIARIAKSHKKTPAQVILRWIVQRGITVIPKSVHPNRIKENIAVFDFKLPVREMEEINGLNRNYRAVDPIEWWGIPYFK
jgi:diketogulonate reductase-like aldo/keto reductase